MATTRDTGKVYDKLLKEDDLPLGLDISQIDENRCTKL